MRSYTNTTAGKVDSAATAIAVTNSVKNNAVVSNAAPVVLCEWKMNSLTACRGVNDLAGGDDFYSSLYNKAERKEALQDKKYAESFANPWRELNNVSTVLAVASKDTALRVRTNPWNGTYTKFYPASDSDGLRTWVSPKPSVTTSAAMLRSAFNKENSARGLMVSNPAGANGSHNRIALGVQSDGAGGAWLLFGQNLPLKPTGKKDKFDWYMPGNQVNLMDDAEVMALLFPKTFNGNVGRTILGVKRGHQVAIYSQHAAVAANNTAVQKKRTLYFGADSWSLLYKGLPILVGSWSAVIAENPVAVKLDGAAFVKVVVSKDIPAYVLKAGANVAFTFTYPAAVKISAGTWGAGKWAYGFYKPVGVTPIVVSKCTNSTQLQNELNNLAKLGGANVKFSNNITWTSKTPTVVVPANMFLNFTGATLTGTGTNGTYMLSIGSTGHRVTSGKTNVTIVGGTWNVGGATGTAVGCMNIIGVTDTLVSGCTINNFSNAPGIFLRGCISTRISKCVISTSVNHATNHNNSAAIAINSYENNKEYNACDKIQINGNTLSSKYGVRSSIFAAGLIGSHKNIKIHNNIITGDIAGVELSDYDQYAIMNNTINIASGQNGINLLTTRTSSTYGYVYANSLLGATPNKHIYIVGSGSDLMVAKVNCIDNVSAGTFGNSPGGATAVSVYIDYGAFIFVESPAGQTMAVTKTVNSAMVYSGTLNSVFYQIKYVQPKVQYFTDKSEVTQIRQLGKKLEVWLSQPLETVKVGSYVNFDGIHPAVDGDKKVLQITYDLDGIARRTKLVLESKLSQTICREGTANKVTPLPWPLEKDDNTGYAHVVKDVQCNKITVKFDIAYGVPKDGVVQVKHNGVWQNVYVFDTGVTPLSNELERDSEYSSANNIRALTIYRNSSGVWSTTESHFDPATNINSIPIDAVRVVVGTTENTNQFVSVTEISARLSADLSTHVKSFSVDKELGDPSDLAPVGSASTNTGTVTFVNPNSLFSENNVSGPFYGLFVKNAMFHIYMNYLSGTIYKTKIATMMSDKWTSRGRESAEVTLVDKSIVLQNMKCRDMVVYNTEEVTSLSLSHALQSLLDSVGFSNYTFKTLNDLGNIEFLWSKKEQTPWEIIKEIALSHQISIYFDEVGKLQIISRGYIYPEKKEIMCSASGAGNVLTAAFASDLDGIRVGMPVYWAGGAFTSKIDSGATVAAVDKTSRKITLLLNSVNGSFTDTMIGFGRSSNYAVIGSNIDNDRIIDRLRLDPVRRSRSFTVSSNEALPTRVGIDPATLEAKPLCSVIRQQPEFYVNNYQSTAGNAVTLGVFASEDDNVSIPTAGSQVYVSNLGAGFDGIWTLTGRSQLGAGWLLNYTGTAGLKAVSSENAGVVGWTTTEAGYKIYGLEVGKKYKFSGMIYIPSANTTGYAVRPSSDATISTSSPASEITTKATWVPFNVNFIANNTEHIVKYNISNGTSSDLLYIYDEEAYFNDDSVSEGGYDEVISAELTKLDRAKKVIVTYKPLNRYGDPDGNAGTATNLGVSSKALLFKDDSGKAIVSFEFLGFKNGRFLYNPSGMNENVAIDQLGGTAEKSKNNVSSPIPYSGKFEYNGTDYKYVGLYAKPAQLKYLAKEMLIKNETDLAYAIELNNGVQPTFTGQGELIKSYSMDIFNFNDPYDPTKSSYVIPKDLTLAPMVPGVELPADLDGSAIVWSSKLKTADHFGFEFSVSSIKNSSGGKPAFIAINIYQDLSEGYQFGIMFNEQGKFSAYGTSMYTVTPKAAAGKKVHPKSTVTGLKVLNSADVRHITKDQLLASASRLEVVAWGNIEKKERYFDLFLGQTWLATFMDDTKSVTEIGYKPSMWVQTGVGAGIVVSSTYQALSKPDTTRDKWYDPGSHRKWVINNMNYMAAVIRAVLKKNYPKQPQVWLDKRAAMEFEKLKKTKGVTWHDTQSLTGYLNEIKRNGGTVDRKVHTFKEEST